MINKENQRRKIEDSKKESKTQTKEQTEGERESLRYSKIYKGEGQEVEDYTRKERDRKEQDLKKTKIRKCMFHLENTKQQRKEGRKRRN